MPRPFLTADWRHLVMLNYEIDPAVLTRYLPRGVELDVWQDRHFVSVVGFMFHNTKVLGVPIPFHRTFAEVNLRFYVVRHVNGERRRGVVFIREVAPRRAVCFIARAVYNEQYMYCPMTQEVRLPGNCVGSVHYTWHGSAGPIKMGAEFTGDPQPLQTDSMEEFITEHYWAYTRQRDGGTKEYHVTHPPWRVWQTKSHQFAGDSVGFYGREFAGTLDLPPASAFVAEGSPVAVYRGHRLLD